MAVTPASLAQLNTRIDQANETLVLREIEALTLSASQAQVSETYDKLWFSWATLRSDIQDKIKEVQSQIDRNSSRNTEAVSAGEALIEQLTNQLNTLKLRPSSNTVEKTAGEQLFEDANQLKADIAAFTQELEKYRAGEETESGLEEGDEGLDGEDEPSAYSGHRKGRTMMG
jgi:molecular chaperone DnaK (HSP70)